MNKSLSEWIKFFTQEFFPSVTKEQSDAIKDILLWDSDKKAGFLLGKDVFECEQLDDKEYD